MIGRAVLGPVLRLRTEKRDPDVRDHARPFRVQQHMRLAGRHPEVVRVALLVEIAARGRARVEALLGAPPNLAHPHGGGGAHASALVRLGQIAEKALGTSNCDGGQKQEES